MVFNPLNAKLNPICHLLALLGAHYILQVSRIRVNSESLQILCLFNWPGDRTGFFIYFLIILSVVSCKSSVRELGFVGKS